MPKKKPIPEPEPEPTFDVEFIRKARVNEDKAWEYFIKWGGYPEEDNSWEPESNLTGCRRILKGFWEQVGPSLKPMARKFPVGYETTPSALWIARERKAYSKTAARKARQRATVLEDDEDEEEEEAQQEEVEEDEEGGGITPEVSKPFQGEAYSDADDLPLSSKVVHESSDDSSSDVAPGNSDTSSRKRKRVPSEDQQELHNAKKRQRIHKRLDAVVISDSVMKGSKSKAKVHESSRSASSSGALFSDSNSEGSPLASKSSTPAQGSTSKPGPTEPQHNQPRARTSSSLTASAPNKSLPAHQQRRLNPRVKPMALPVSHAGGPVGISTKARISGLSTGNIVQRPANSAPSLASPVVVNQASTTTSNSTIAPQSAASVEIDALKWLQDNFPMTDQVEHSPAPPSITNISQNLHFSKRFRWSGQLAIGDNESEDASTEPVGGILLTDNTPLDQSVSEIGIEQLFPSHVDSICLRHTYALPLLPTVIADYKIPQFARMRANQSNEENSFDDIVAYMVKHELYSQAPLFIGDRNVAMMFVFPACFEHLWDPLGVPPKARQSDDLLVAIGFQVFKPPRGALDGPMEAYTSNWKTSVKTSDIVPDTYSLACYRALLALSFPDALYKRIIQKECTIFTTLTQNDSPDTLALITILNSAPGCKITSIITGSARFVFIHVAAWHMLHKLPGLVDRRRRRPDIQFYTYGSDAAVELKHWGVHEVFPIGGIVTFTPRAVAEDPAGVEALIGKLDEHPLWVCYVVPSVVAMVVEVIKSDKGPDPKLKSAVEALSGLLIPIENGQLALTWQMPHVHAWHKEKDDTHFISDRISWMTEQAHLSDLPDVELVKACQKWLGQRSQERSEKAIESSIVNDMLVMQSDLRYEYRRFVIITDSTGASNSSREAAANNSASKADIKDGFEFTHVNEFSFGDDYKFVDSIWEDSVPGSAAGIEGV